MQHILVIGAGRSATSLIEYLLDQSSTQQWKVTVADLSLNLAEQKVNNHPAGNAIALDTADKQARRNSIAQADIVVSMLPAFMHITIANDCLALGKHLVTASYVSPEMQALHQEAKAKNLIFLNEMGLDPGIDHMSAMQIIDRIHGQGGKITSFKSYCGGLVAPESNDNPWGYKFSWNPRNVVVAGQSGAHYLENGQQVHLPYSSIFAAPVVFQLNQHESFDGYPNRDSLSYQAVYGLNHVATLIRGTLRELGYCQAWQALVLMGLTDDQIQLELPTNTTWAVWAGKRYEQLVMENPAFADEVVKQKLTWLGLFDSKPLGKTIGTAATILLDLLESKWLLEPHDKDRIVMIHHFTYELNKKVVHLQSALDLIGTDTLHTAMAKTVGLPLGIGVKLIHQQNIKARGVMIPISSEIYEPALAQLSKAGIRFIEAELN